MARSKLARAIALYQKGHSFAEIARRLEISPSTARRWIKELKPVLPAPNAKPVQWLEPAAKCRAEIFIVANGATHFCVLDRGHAGLHKNDAGATFDVLASAPVYHYSTDGKHFGRPDECDACRPPLPKKPTFRDWLKKPTPFLDTWELLGIVVVAGALAFMAFHLR